MGSTLALAYAEAHPTRVKQLLLRGIFTFLPDEVDTLFQDGRAANHYPDEWAAYVDHIRLTSDDWAREQHNLVGAYRDRLLDPSRRMAAAKAFVTYELSISHLHKNTDRIAQTLKRPGFWFTALKFITCFIAALCDEGNCSTRSM